MNKPHVTAIILAAGSGTRMGADITKQRMTIGGETVLQRCVAAFNSSDAISDIIVVVRNDELDFARRETKDFEKIKNIIIGGKTRAESAKLGFLATEEICDYVAIHDAARCLCPKALIDQVIADAVKYGAASASGLIYDTVKEADENGFIKCTHDRSSLRLAQTPQVFAKELYQRAIDEIDVLDPTITDDNMLLERISVPVYLSDSHAFNLKLTTPKDALYAEFLLAQRLINEKEKI